MKDLMPHQHSLGQRSLRCHFWMTIAFTLPIAMVSQPVGAQDKARFPMPDAVAPNTILKVDGDTSMKGINATLKSQFESKFAATKVELAESTSTGALQALREGKIQVAAIGRPLTEAELADGLVSVPIAFNKIGIFTGKDNPFAQSLTNDQFAKIFRGEITDWKDVGGEAGPIVLVDRPDSSDTRVSFSRYPVFKAAPFAAGTTASKIDKDTNESVVLKLGKTGIGYALAEQVTGRSDLKIVPLHKVLPDNPKYSFSQPLSYVYKGPTPTPEVAAFLGFAQDASNEGAIETARKVTVSVEGGLAAAPVAVAPLNASASPMTSPAESTSSIAPANVAVNTPAVDPAPVGGFDWRWLLPLLGIPLIGAWLLRRKPEEELGDVGGSAGLGAVVPAVGAAAIGTAGLGALGLLGKPKTDFIVTARNCRDAYAYWDLDSDEAKHMADRGGRNLALRTYDVTDDDLKRPDRSQYQQTDCDDRSQDHHLNVLRDDRYYVTDLGYVTAKNEWIRLATSDMYHVPSCALESSALAGASSVGTQPIDRPDAIPEAITVRQISRQTADVNLPNTDTVARVAVGGAGLASGAVSAGLVRDRIADETTSEITTQPPLSYSVDQIASEQVDPKVSHIIMVPKNDRDAYVYWELNQAERDRAIENGGQQFVLRVGDAHGQPLDGNTRHSFRQYDLDEQSCDRHVHLPVTSRDYFTEVGYLTRDQRWVSLARSTPVHA